MKLLDDSTAVYSSMSDPEKYRETAAQFRDALTTKSQARKRKLSEASDGDVSVSEKRGHVEVVEEDDSATNKLSASFTWSDDFALPAPTTSQHNDDVTEPVDDDDAMEESNDEEKQADKKVATRIIYVHVHVLASILTSIFFVTA